MGHLSLKNKIIKSDKKRLVKRVGILIGLNLLVVAIISASGYLVWFMSEYRALQVRMQYERQMAITMTMTITMTMIMHLKCHYWIKCIVYFLCSAISCVIFADSTLSFCVFFFRTRTLHGMTWSYLSQYQL